MFIPNGEWVLVGMPSKLNKVFYNCCKYPFYDVTLHLIIKRKPLYYVFNLILPCALIATLTLLKFFIPPESGEKVGLGITVLLAMTVFLLLVADTLPATSDDIPLLGQYFVATMFVTALSLVGTCIVLNFFHRNPATSPMPRWVRVVILGYMAKVFCFQMEDEEKEAQITPRRKSSENHCGPEYLLETSANALDPESPHRRAQNLDDISISVLRGRSISVISRKSVNAAPPHPLSERLLENVTVLADDVRARQNNDRQREEWRIAALVLDRMFFWLFLITSFLTTFFIFYRGPVVDGWNRHLFTRVEISPEGMLAVNPAWTERTRMLKAQRPSGCWLTQSRMSMSYWEEPREKFEQNRNARLTWHFPLGWLFVVFLEYCSGQKECCKLAQPCRNLGTLPLSSSPYFVFADSTTGWLLLYLHV